MFWFAQVLAATTAVSAAGAGVKNFFLISVDDLRPEFGASFGNPEVLTPNMDKHFTNGGGSAMQHSYVQIAVCGPSRSSMLTGRRPDTTTAGVSGQITQWCWCQRTNCEADSLFMTLPTYFAQNGHVTSGNGKLFHPDACTLLRGIEPSFGPDFAHLVGDDARAWNHGDYGVEGMLQQPFDNATNQFSEEQWGTIPGPREAIFANWTHTQGPDWMRSPLSDEEQTDGQLATDTVNRIANFSDAGIGKAGGKPFFLSTGFHKPHTPWIVPSKYFDLYDTSKVSLPPNPHVPAGFTEEHWHANGNREISGYQNPGAIPEPFDDSVFGFRTPVDNQTVRELRHAYFAATSFVDAQIGRVMDALEKYGYLENTIVALWSDHGYHLGDTNSWCKMTNFEHATRNTLFWRVPGQVEASKGRNNRFVEMVDLFPTVIDLVGLPKIAPCTGVDQPPTVTCLQGKSYADEFLPALAASPSDPKQHTFSQWPYPIREAPGEKKFRMGYTVRGADGYRLTQYVLYDRREFKGDWTEVPTDDDLELYDYNNDPHETTNQAANPTYSDVVKRLRAVLKEQYNPSS
jgi:iduronate 2-sulfatase